MQKISEKGRSLLEVIAILVIIAVIVLASLALFNTLIKEYQRKDTVKTMNTIVTRYKSTNLMRKRNGQVLLKSIIPGATGDSIDSSDGGRFTLKDDDDSFVVIKQGSQLSCRDILEERNYDRVGYGDTDNYSAPTKTFSSDHAFTEADIIAICSGYQYFYYDKDKGTTTPSEPEPLPPAPAEPEDVCADVVPVEHCDGTPEVDGNGCPTVTLFSCPDGTYCHEHLRCCVKNEIEPECYSAGPIFTPDPFDPLCPVHKEYEEKECNCADLGAGFTSSTCGEDYKEDQEQVLGSSSIVCHKCVLKTCAEKFGAGWELTAPACKAGLTLDQKNYVGGTCYKCSGTPTCPICHTVEMSSPTGCIPYNEDIGECAHCENGDVKLDTLACQTCVKNENTGKYEWQNKEPGDNKQADGQCCINGELKYDDTYCPEPETELCEVPLYSQKYRNDKNNKQTAETKTGCCTNDKLTTTSAKALIDPVIQGYLWEDTKSAKYYCCKEGYETTGSNCCLIERNYQHKTCCQANQLATESGCCAANRTYEENGVKKCCDKVMCGTSCCAFCDASGQMCGDCEAPLYTKAYSKNSSNQTATAGCCTQDRLIAGSTNALFHGYKWGENTLSYCCPEGFEILGDPTKTSSKCCSPDKVYTNSKGEKGCCANNQIPVGNTCCVEARKYVDSEGNEKCCSQNLVKSTDGTMVCQTDKTECRPLSIGTKLIGYSKKVKMCYLNDAETKWKGCNDPAIHDIYNIYYNDTITPLHDLELDFNILGMIDMSDSHFLEDDVLDPSFVQKISVKEVGGKTLLNKSGLSSFQGCNKLGYIRYKYPKSKYDKYGNLVYSTTYDQTGDITAKGFHDEKITLKAGKQYKIDIDIKNVCKSCLIDTACSIQ